jgi:membrane-bound metal-dependent hydrolase YbcI (DUF457 family)
MNIAECARSAGRLESQSPAMPVTPFHFGPGALLKGCASRSVSLAAFVASQIAIDIESGYHLLHGDWPVHREAHSLMGATRLRAALGFHPLLAIELLPAFVGGLVGGMTHSILDAVMHPDLRPFWPFSVANPFLDLIGIGLLHTMCVASGLAGAVLLVIQSRRTTRVG